MLYVLTTLRVTHPRTVSASLVVAASAPDLIGLDLSFWIQRRPLAGPAPGINSW
jgi:hypothetical protein